MGSDMGQGPPTIAIAALAANLDRDWNCFGLAKTRLREAPVDERFPQLLVDPIAQALPSIPPETINHRTSDDIKKRSPPPSVTYLLSRLSLTLCYLSVLCCMH